MLIGVKSILASVSNKFVLWYFFAPNNRNMNFIKWFGHAVQSKVCIISELRDQEICASLKHVTPVALLLGWSILGFHIGLKISVRKTLSTLNHNGANNVHFNTAVLIFNLQVTRYSGKIAWSLRSKDLFTSMSFQFGVTRMSKMKMKWEQLTSLMLEKPECLYLYAYSILNIFVVFFCTLDKVLLSEWFERCCMLLCLVVYVSII